MEINEVRELWIKELGTDNYKFGKGMLVDIDKEGVETHCALGVLAELAHQRGIISRALQNEYGPFDMNNVEEGEWTFTALVPESVRKWAGLTINQTRDIATVNDGSYDYTPAINLIKVIP